MKFIPPQYPKKLPGTFWGITTFFNPQGYKNKIKNYREFRISSQKQGLKLLTVELAFGHHPFELRKEDADILIQLRTKDIMWHRESLVNVGLKRLPQDCDKFAWIDNDLIFENDNWVKEVPLLLAKYKVVQLFSSVSWMPKVVLNSTAFKVARHGLKVLDSFDLKTSGHTGFAWAARRSIFAKDGFYNRCVMGGCDRYIVLAFFNELSQKSSLFKCQTSYQDALAWGKKLGQKVRGSVFFVKGHIIHLYHGRLEERQYGLRDILLAKYNFDPLNDIKEDENGLLVWHSAKKNLHQAVKKYFWLRNEEGKNRFLRFYGFSR